MLAGKGRSKKDRKWGKCQSERQNVNFQFTQRKRKTSKSMEGWGLAKAIDTVSDFVVVFISAQSKRK